MSHIPDSPGLRAVLFDLDGVLIDSNRAWFLTFNDICRSVGILPVSPAEFRRNVLGRSLAHECKHYFTMLTEKDLSAQCARLVPRHLAAMKAFPDARPVLSAVRRAGLKIGVVTNTPRRIASSVLTRSRLRPFVQTIVGGEEVPGGKPDPEMIWTACRRLRVAPAFAIYVGDTPTDRQTARAAGVRFFGLGLPGNVRLHRLADLRRSLP